MLKKFTLLMAALLWLPVLWQTTPAAAQGGDAELPFEQFDLPNGEGGNHVQSIVQDHYGFLWFGSQYGLHRWDGRQFKTYLHDPRDASSISSDYVEYIHVAKDGSLWLGSWGGGLNHFRHETETFTRYKSDKRRKNSLANNFVSVILEDRAGYIWVGTMGGLDRLDPETGDIRHFKNDPFNKNSLSCDYVRALYEDSQGTLWVGTGFPFSDEKCGGLNRFDPKTESFTRFEHDRRNPKTLAGNRVRAIYEDARGIFWIGTDGDGLQQFDRATGLVTRYPNANPSGLSAPKAKHSSQHHVTFIKEDNQRRLWIGDFGGGFRCFDPKTGKSNLIQHTPGKKGLLENAAWTMFQSKDGIIWFCTAGEQARVFKTSGKSKPFATVKLPGKENYVKSFSDDDRDNLWVATSNSAIGTLKTNPENQAGIVNPVSVDALLNNASKIVANPDSSVWLIRKDTAFGLRRYFSGSKALRHYEHDPVNPNSLGSNFINDILKDKKGNLWIATNDAGLDYFNSGKEIFRHFRHRINEPNSLPFNQLEKLFLDQDGQLWVAGTEEQNRLFIARFNPAKEIFTRFQLPELVAGKNFWQSPPAQDRRGNIWVCLENGILKLDPASRESSFFDRNHLGKDAGQLKGMVLDNDDKLWVLGHDLLLFDPEKETVFSFGKQAGIYTAPFQDGAIYKNEQGEIFIGGRSGFQYFDPRQFVATEKGPPSIRITDFELLDRDEITNFDRVRLSAIWQGEPLVLTHGQNAFSFRFAALDFTNPLANRLEFMLENFDEYWRLAEDKPEAIYVKVPPGDYVFRVRGANEMGVWGKEAVLKITVLPPWWRTWWAWSLYTLTAAALALAVYKSLLKRRLVQAEALRLKEMDAVKNRLYANITHEFRTPLTVILGMAQLIRESPGEHFRNGLDLIERNGENLLRLVNQMLELSKLENGSLPLHWTQGDVVAYLKYLVESFRPLAQSKRVQVHFLSETEQLVMDYDPGKWQQVVSNLLSNAIKFTPADGNIYVQLKQVNDAPNPQLSLSVRDTGAGISEDHLPHVFDRFFQADSTTEGAGIGLALVKELVKLLGGDIRVKSQFGQGAEFTMTLPVHHRADLQWTNDDWGTNDLRLTNDDLRLSDDDAIVFPASEAENQSKIENRQSEIEKPLILLVEDNHDVVAYLASCLAKDYRISVAKDGYEGVEIALETIPDLIVTDIMMPRRSGYDLCQILKNDERTNHIPIVMLTAKADISSKLEGLTCGADAYLAKPFHRQELLVHIENLLELRRKMHRRYQTTQPAMSVETLLPAADKTTLPEDPFVAKARAAVEARLDDYGFSVEDFCQTMTMSHSQLHRKLAALTGLSASKFIRHIRLEKAKTLLLDPDLSITAVAFETGFNDPSYFGRVFKQTYNATPVEWREKSLLGSGAVVAS